MHILCRISVWKVQYTSEELVLAYKSELDTTLSDYIIHTTYMYNGLKDVNFKMMQNFPAEPITNFKQHKLCTEKLHTVCT